MDSVRFKNGKFQHLAYQGGCPFCQHDSMYVKTTGALGIKCAFPYCPFANKYRGLECELQFRDYQAVDVSYTMEGEMPFTGLQAPDGTVKDVEPDFEQVKPKFEEVWTNCHGVLNWAGGEIGGGRYQWLVCGECQAQYRACVLREKRTIVAPDGDPFSRYHDDYRLNPIQDSDQWAVVPKSERATHVTPSGHPMLAPWTEDLSKPVPSIWILVIDAVRYKGEMLYEPRAVKR